MIYVSSYIYYVYFQVTDISIILNWFLFYNFNEQKAQYDDD